MFNHSAPSKLLRRYCQSCGNLTSLHVTRSLGPDYTQTYIFVGISVLIISILGLAKLYI